MLCEQERRLANGQEKLDEVELADPRRNDYSRDYPVERWHRDAKDFTNFEGTSEIHRMIISRAVIGLEVG